MRPVLRAPADPRPAVDIVRDRDVLSAYLEDASGVPPGRAAGLARPADEAEAVAVMAAAAASGATVLFQGARSSLTAGAVPDGEVVVSLERLRGVGAVETHDGGARVRVRPGERLADLQAELAAAGWYFPPVPTYQEAMVGGAVATNAGGAATFKYGVTRDWVRGLRVVLHDGSLLEVERGQSVAGPGGTFELEREDGSVVAVPAPVHVLPPLKKISAGYRGDDPLDLVDLFVGSEGTLGLVVEATLDLVRRPPATIAAALPLPDLATTLRLTAALREAALRAREAGDPAGPDVRSIEWIDERCTAMLRRRGDDARLRADVPQDRPHVLFVEMELPEPLDRDAAESRVVAFLEGDAADEPVARLCAILAEHDALECAYVAFPDDDERRAALMALREAAPSGVNEELAARRRADAGVVKVGGDLIVPCERLDEAIAMYREGFERRGLDYAIWGHLSDGNLHPNAVPRSAAETKAGYEALLEFARAVIPLGGCPLSEHGVGRNPLKQTMLREFVGAAAIEGMRRTKRALDPDWRLAPGVLFPAP